LERDALRCAAALTRKPGRPGRKPRFEGTFGLPSPEMLRLKKLPEARKS